MSDGGALTAGSRARIRGFSAAVSVLGVIVIGLIGFLTASNLPGIGGGGGGAIASDPEYQYRPWTNPHPVAATRDGDTFTGRGQAYISLAGLEPGVPLLLDFDADGPIQYLNATGPKGTELDGGHPEIDLTTYGDDNYLLPGTEEVELWVSGRDAEQWSLTVRDAGIAEKSGVVSGTSSMKFLYTGPATTARIVTSGQYSITIMALTARGWVEVFSSFDAAAKSVAWDDSPATLFVVRGYGDSSWSMEFHEPEPDPTPAPDPSPSPSAAPTEGAADE